MKIGINLPMSPDPQTLRGHIVEMNTAGFTHFEMGLGALPLIVNGELNRRWLACLKDLLDEFPYTFSAHIGQGIDCRNSTEFDMHRRALLSSVEAAGRLGMIPLVLHYEQRSDSPETERRFYEVHREAADLAAELGTSLCIENIEVERVDPVIEMVTDIDHPNLRMAYDLGHAFLAARYFGFDHLEALKKALPVIGHLHLSDNSGTFEELRITDRAAYDALDLGYRFAFGRGDVHLPPLWGSLPYPAIAEIIKGYSGIAVCEFYSEHFRPFLKEIHSETDRLLNGSEPR